MGLKKALLVIDMQNICVGQNHAELFKYHNAELIDAVNEVIEANKNNIVIYIKNVMKRNLINRFAPFHAYEGTKDVELVDGLQIISANVYPKYKGNALTNPDLKEFLRKNEIESVEVVGVDGGGCVALTALGAIHEGYKVIVNEKAIGTMFEKNKAKYFEKLKNSGAQFIE